MSAPVPVAAPDPGPGPASVGGPAPAVPFLRSAKAVFDLALEGMLWSRRSVAVLVLLLLPVLFGVLYRVALATRISTRIAAADLYGVVVGFFYVSQALPLVALFYASSLIADEVEAKTITYLLTRPIRRSAILCGKFAAYCATTCSLALPALVVTFFLLMTQRGRQGVSAGAPDLVRDLGVMVLALLAYGALFTLMGVLLKRPLLAGLFYIYGWELLAYAPGWSPRLTITAWLKSLLRHRPAGQGIGEAFAQALPVGQSLVVLSATIVVCLAAAGWIFARRQYVLEQ
jgi:ABC-2 type transport system permease protein